MKFLRCGLCCLLICIPPFCAADSASANTIAQELEGKVAFLRGMDLNDKLAFDAKGAPLIVPTAGPFSLSALKIEKVRQSGADIEIKGKRLELIFEPTTKDVSLGDFRFVRVPASVNIKIAIDPDHPIDAAIKRIFALNVEDEFSGMTSKEVNSALSTVSPELTASRIPDIGKIREVAGPVWFERYTADSNGVYPPLIIHSVGPASAESSFAKEPHRKAWEGICVVSLVVDPNGVPQNVQIARSLNPEMDQKAIDAVRQYRFFPAMHNGKPVAATIHLEVNFRVY